MENKIKITVVGDGATGKTCMLILYKDRTFDSDHIPTIFDAYATQIPISDQTYTVILQDTGGQEEWDRIRTFAYTATDVFILCYAINNVASMENAREKWAPELRKHCPNAKLILVGTKCDLDEERTVPHRVGEKLSRQIKADRFIENSAKQGNRRYHSYGSDGRAKREKREKN